MIKQCFFDIDGTCNRAVETWFRANHCGGGCYGRDSSYPLPGNYDVVAACNELNARHKRPFVTAEVFWQRVTRGAWANSPPSDEFYWLLELGVRLVGKDNVYFLTKPTASPECAAGKVQWIQRHAPDFMREQFFIGAPKRAVARAGALLVDDSDKEVNEWIAAGGTAILVPRPWNSKSHLRAMPYLREQFNALLYRRQPDATPAFVKRLQSVGLVPSCTL